MKKEEEEREREVSFPVLEEMLKTALLFFLFFLSFDMCPLRICCPTHRNTFPFLGS